MSFISFSSFSFFNKIGNGSVISTKSFNLEITCSHFESNSVTEFGGSIFLIDSSLYLSKTSFFKCYSTSKTNDVSGNALYQAGAESFVNNTSTQLCGISKDKCSDSSMKFEYSLIKINSINASSNYGYYGSSFCSFRSGKTNSYMEYSNCYRVYDNYAIESSINDLRIDKCNFIYFNKTFNTAILWMNDNNKFKFVECSFFETDDVQLSANDIECEFENCFSNSNFYSSISCIQTISIFYPNLLNLKCHKGLILTNLQKAKFDIFLFCVVFFILQK